MLSTQELPCLPSAEDKAYLAQWCVSTQGHLNFDGYQVSTVTTFFAVHLSHSELLVASREQLPLKTRKTFGSVVGQNAGHRSLG